MKLAAIIALAVAYSATASEDCCDPGMYRCNYFPADSTELRTETLFAMGRRHAVDIIVLRHPGTNPRTVSCAKT